MLHRVVLRLEAPLATPLVSGTLFGHLCWARRLLAGEAALVGWLDDVREGALQLSSAFPHGLLPRPLLSPAPPPEPDRSRAGWVHDLERAKDVRKRAWVPLEVWRELRACLDDAVVGEHARRFSEAPQRLAHNTIDRHRSTTPDEGGLFFVDEDWSFFAEPRRDLYVRTDLDIEAIVELLTFVGEQGYGRDATWGRGQFRVEVIEDAGWLDEHDGDRRTSLSHGSLSANMADARYRTLTHFGKASALATAAGGRPWKYPLLLQRPGATFGPTDDGPFGHWLTGLHPDRPEIVHNAYHLAIPCREAAA